MAQASAGALVCRNVMVNGRRTSIKLEKEFWRLLGALAEDSGLRQEDILNQIRAARPAVPLTTSVRVAVLLYQEAAAKTLPRPQADMARDQFNAVVLAMQV